MVETVRKNKEPDPEMGKVVKTKPKKNEVYSVTGQKIEDMRWGPFAEYTVVSTPVGQVAVPHSTVVRLEPYEHWNPKSGKVEKRWKAVSEQVKTNDPRIVPTPRLTAEDQDTIKKMKEERSRS